MAKIFVATKTRSNRPGWSIIFRHPRRHDTQGRLGLKVRRGLGTSDDDEADALVEQMNTILRDPTWWSPARRAEAEKRFASAIVKAFFDELQAGTLNPLGLRDRYIELPGAEQGYARVLFVGTTGAGKTTLLRQLIGSDPITDRFPSTAPAKTTIADIEVVVGGETYDAIVTFFTKFQVQAQVEECILDAAMAAHNGANDARVAERFLNHRDQKFRLSYILGSWGGAALVDEDDDGEDDDDHDDDASAPLSESESVSDGQRRANREVLEGLVARIRSLARAVSTEISVSLGVDHADVPKEDQDAYLQLLGEAFEESLWEQDDFHNLVQDVLDHVQSRFEAIEDGELSYGLSGWPETWTYSAPVREQFLANLRFFSSNHWPQFGRLLTPVVNGIRLRGPLHAQLPGEPAKLVLIDGQGIGHTPDDATSLTTHITSRFDLVDVILLVDNAQQPMQAAPLSVLKALALSGFQDKLAIAFTHFDQIKGQNLPTMADRRAHVMASVVSALAKLQETVSSRSVQSLERGIDDRCFMLSSTQKKLSGLGPKRASYMTGQLQGLVGFIVAAAQQEEVQETPGLVYDPMGMSFAVQDGAKRFNQAWRARLGLGTYANLRKQHWTRIKALNKRIAAGLDEEYDNLRPVADLETSLLQAIAQYLDAPVSAPEDVGEQPATSRARRLVAAQLAPLVRTRLLDNPIEAWRAAYEDRGPGSASRRAERLAGILQNAAPVPDLVMSAEASAFLISVSGIVSSAITAVGGRLQPGGSA